MGRSAADTPFKLLNRVASGVSFLTVDVLESICGIIVHAVLTKSNQPRMHAKSNPMHPLYGVLYLCRMCHYGLYAVFLYDIGNLMLFLAADLAEPQDFYFPRCVSVE